jgi:hypothetical protein
VETLALNQREQDELLGIVKRSLPDSDGIALSDIHSLPGGGNNRLFKVNVSGTPIVLKYYFRHPGDLRNRLDNEYRISEFLWQRGVRCIPEPLARDDGFGTGLYRYVDGTAINPAQVTHQLVQEACSFLSQANKWRQDSQAQDLPDASEACFTLQQHLDLVEQRVQRLLNLSPTGNDIREKASAFVRQRLLPVWHGVRGECLKRIGETNQLLEEPLSTVDRILSPSDFGFHNVLRTEHGLVFHDFEYAGWDDPAKTACDFFCQIAVPVPLQYWKEVSCDWAKLTHSPDKMLLRMDVLLPVYRIKWVCIALNHFLAVDGERRRFAKGNSEMLCATQLGLAEILMSSIQY